MDIKFSCRSISNTRWLSGERKSAGLLRALYAATAQAIPVRPITTSTPAPTQTSGPPRVSRPAATAAVNTTPHTGHSTMLRCIHLPVSEKAHANGTAHHTRVRPGTTIHGLHQSQLEPHRRSRQPAALG